MELLSGQTLRQLLQGPRIAPNDGLRIMLQVALGLRAIHERGILHRDLSANNVMTTKGDAVKILDLGLAKDLKTLSTISREGYLVGTIAYVSPEQIDGKPATVASDLFAFGVLLYEVLTGRHPFYAEHHMSMLYNIAHRQPGTDSDEPRQSTPGVGGLGRELPSEIAGPNDYRRSKASSPYYQRYFAGRT